MPMNHAKYNNPYYFQKYMKTVGYLVGLVFMTFIINACQPLQPVNKSINPIILTSSSIRTPVPTISLRQEPIPNNIYYVANDGNDTNPGTLSQPWKTIQKVTSTVKAGDLVYVRGGNYSGIDSGWIFQNSGTQTNPITLTNYPDEQVIFKLTGDLFVCSINQDNQAWKTPKADYIRIIGTDVLPIVISNTVESKKGIVILGAVGAQGAGFSASDCDNWEIAGVDFVDVGYGIFTFKNNWGLPEEHSTDSWYVHDNRVYGFYRESGMQFNGDNNLIENNEIYKVTNRVDTPYGCQILNLLGDNNIVRGNTLSGLGSTALCPGIMFEWDMADTNLVEQNLIYDVKIGIDIEGGDNNMIRNNIVYRLGSPGPFNAGIEIKSYDSTKTNWPCNEGTGSAQALLPPNDPTYPDYSNYYSTRNCHSTGNQIFNNVIDGFVEGIRFYPLLGEDTVIRNNIFSRWTRGSICFYNDNGTCKKLPPEITESNNATKNFGFVDLQHYNFHLAADSPLIDNGYDLLAQNPNDFDGEKRPQGEGYDIGAYESPYLPAR
jgi:parallel beta-helix repeat protein